MESFEDDGKMDKLCSCAYCVNVFTRARPKHCYGNQIVGAISVECFDIRDNAVTWGACPNPFMLILYSYLENVR